MKSVNVHKVLLIWLSTLPLLCKTCCTFQLAFLKPFKSVKTVVVFNALTQPWRDTVFKVWRALSTLRRLAL